MLFCSKELYNKFQEIKDTSKKEILIFSDNNLPSTAKEFNNI